MSESGLQTVSDCCSLFQYVSDAVAVFSFDGGLVFANEAFKQLDEDCQPQITQSVKSAEDSLYISSSSELVVGVTTSKKIKLSDGFAFIVSDKHRTGSVTEDTLNLFKSVGFRLKS